MRLPRAIAKTIGRKGLKIANLAFDEQCDVCGNPARWKLPFGNPVRWNAECPHCGSLERHRLHARVLRRELAPAGKALVVAPDAATLRVLGEKADWDVTTTDLLRDDVDVQADATDLPFADGAFDLVVCSHVLEHIPDDRAAMQELARVTARDGFALIAVPLRQGAAIDEDPSIASKAERKRRFGQSDHVRWYVYSGFLSRLEEAGFSVEPSWSQRHDPADYRGSREPAFVCRPRLRE